MAIVFKGVEQSEHFFDTIARISQDGWRTSEKKDLQNSKFKTFPNGCFILHIPHTSSTAQGGGGSFKNRKRIGEIDCCE